jgi:creatinine amidohydrolase/Fe(II)-dependent formamide hydrolase-like protein
LIGPITYHSAMARPAWLVLFFIAASAAAAHAQDSVFIDELTSTEVAALVRAGKTTALVPIGGTEQSGPHIVLGKHNVRARVLGGKIAVALGNALVAPVIAYVPEGSVDPPSAHMRFAGTLTIPEKTFESVLEYAARSLRASGFRDIVFLGDHGGYQRNEQAVAARLDREWSSSPVRVHALVDYYRAAEIAYSKALQARGYTAAEDRHTRPVSPTRRSRSPSIRRSCARRSSTRRMPTRRMACAAIRGARAKRSGCSASTRSCANPWLRSRAR